MTQTLLCLVGEQPIANLLPILHLRPDCVVLATTRHPDSQRIALALQRVLAERHIAVVILLLSSEYSIVDTQAELERFLTEQGLTLTQINVTGGTKATALAALLVAQAHGVPLCYLESNQRTQNQLYRSEIRQGVACSLGVDTISNEVPLDLFIRSFGYPLQFKEPTDSLERAVRDAIASMGYFEIRTGVQIDAARNSDIDIMLRYKDRYAVIEVKSVVWESCVACGKQVKPKPKQALEQIVTISEQRIFGTYTIRLLVLHCNPSDVHKLDGIMDMARILNTRPILIHDSLASGTLTAADATRVEQGVYSAFGIPLPAAP